MTVPLAAYALVGESEAEGGVAVEEVASVDDVGGGEAVADVSEVDPTEFVPFGEHDECFGSVTGIDSRRRSLFRRAAVRRCLQ